MSHYYSAPVRLPILTNQKALGRNQQSVSDALVALAAARPELAAELAEVDWDEVITHVAQLALKQVAAEENCVFETQYCERGIKPKRGECIGALRSKNGSTRMGLSKDGQSLSFFWRSESSTPDATQSKWQKAFEHAYREQVFVAALRIIGVDEVERRKSADGDVHLEVLIKEEN